MLQIMSKWLKRKYKGGTESEWIIIHLQDYKITFHVSGIEVVQHPSPFLFIRLFFSSYEKKIFRDFRIDSPSTYFAVHANVFWLFSHLWYSSHDSGVEKTTFKPPSPLCHRVLTFFVRCYYKQAFEFDVHNRMIQFSQSFKIYSKHDWKSFSLKAAKNSGRIWRNLKRSNKIH